MHQCRANVGLAPSDPELITQVHDFGDTVAFAVFNGGFCEEYTHGAPSPHRMPMPNEDSDLCYATRAMSAAPEKSLQKAQDTEPPVRGTGESNRSRSKPRFRANAECTHALSLAVTLANRARMNRTNARVLAGK